MTLEEKEIQRKWDEVLEQGRIVRDNVIRIKENKEGLRNGCILNLYEAVVELHSLSLDPLQTSKLWDWGVFDIS